MKKKNGREKKFLASRRPFKFKKPFMFKKPFKFRKFLFILFICVFVFVSFVNIYMVSFAKKYTYKNAAAVPEKYTLIIPGAKVYSNTVSFVVRDRIEAAVQCFDEGKGQKYLVSGDHGQKNYDEVNQIRKYMITYYGVDDDLIFMDHAGFSTYETMYRARDIFCVKDAVIVTQKFHTARSVYIARKLGIDAVAYVAPEVNKFSRRTKLSWEIRECFARVKTFFLVLFKAKPTYLGDQIPITSSAEFTRD